MDGLSSMAEAGPEGLDAVFGGGGLAGLHEALVEVLGEAARLVESERIKSRVWRLRFNTTAPPKSVIVKQLDPVVAYRNRMLVERWLPAVALENAGPGLLAHAADPSGQRAWQVYQDLGEAGLDRDPNDRQRTRAAVRRIAELHLRFADHAVLGECRLWGGNLGNAFYTGNVRDAMRALEALARNQLELLPEVDLARELMMQNVQQLLDEERDRCRALDEGGGPETLVHGDLWPMNVFVLGEGDRLQVRLIDWDHTGVARFPYDLSTFLIRLPVERRTELLEEYKEVVEPRGWTLPGTSPLNALFDTAERSRIVSHIVWPALALLRKDAALRSWALASLVEVSGWFEALEPVLPCERSAVA